MDAALSTNMHYLPDPEIRRRTMAAAAAFGAPYNVVFWGVDEGATLTSGVERRGILSVGTELGGWGRVNIEGVRIGERGLLNVLKHFGLMEGNTRHSPARRLPGHAPHDGARPACYYFAPTGGVFEPRHTVGETVEEGELAGFLHFVEESTGAPIEVRYRRAGVLWMAAGPDASGAATSSPS